VSILATKLTIAVPKMAHDDDDDEMEDMEDKDERVSSEFI
jgi:hypothetical protein